MYADDKRWAIVFEQTGYHNKDLDVEIQLNYYGNCLINLNKAGNNNKYVTNIRNYETFQQIAMVLNTKDTSIFKPTLKPNNDWLNWPNGGAL